MADAGVDIDLYANIDDDFNQESEYNHEGSVDLYDDVITAPSEVVHNTSSGPPTPLIESKTVNHKPPTFYSRKYTVVVGNLTWWTTDQDLTDAISSLGCSDLIEIKFYENRANGQSKGFASVTVGSETSQRAIFDKLSKLEIHGAVPEVTHFNKQAINHFDNTTRSRDDPPSPPHNNDMGGRGPPFRPPLRPLLPPGEKLLGPPPSLMGPRGRAPRPVMIQQNQSQEMRLMFPGPGGPLRLPPPALCPRVCTHPG